MAAQAAAAPTSSKYQPSDFLKAVLGRPVVVKLNSGVAYKGVLACLDGYMNIAMEQTEVSASHDHLVHDGVRMLPMRLNDASVGSSGGTRASIAHRHPNPK